MAEAPRRKRRRTLVALGSALAVLSPLAYLWATSLVPGEYSAMEMGYVDNGGGPAHAGDHQEHGQHGRSVAELRGPDGKPDVDVTVTARKEKFTLASGQTVDGFTLNGSSPGPAIRARLGDLVQVTLVNESVPEGATLHWHGIDVPNAEDGVAGVTQDSVAPGKRHTYRFRAEQAGTYWYHSHQVSSEQVRDGLFGTIVIDGPAPVRDVIAAIHTYDDRRSINGHTGQSRLELPAGTKVRVRVINTDNAVIRTGLAGATYRVVAVDGRELRGPTPVSGAGYLLPAGGRVDLAAVVPSDGSALRLDAGSAATSLLIGPRDSRVPAVGLSAENVDLLSYGTPAGDLGFDPERADRRFEYRIGRRPGFLDGKPGLWWTINGKLMPDVPMYMVSEGDVVRMRITNTSGQAHPMHLHGHHAIVLSRDGVASSGSPWWTDTLEVGDGETYEIAFLADNPGIWMDHCHNLPHAKEGLMTHLAYTGVTTPYRIGGQHHNEPE
ncbi:multicopper oxidase family protein [Kribbella deserti]|uniref:Multicopper oxidase family protein n=1 Tax=Kribbella deserti TaxID=1926257 RepID=A0ABV6QPI1_9ACTN